MVDDNEDEVPTTYRGPDAPVRTYVSTEILTIEPSASVREAARLIAGASVGCLVVGTTEQVEAIVSERDVVRAVAEGADLDQLTVGELGSHRLVWATIDDTVGDVAEEMMEDYVRHVLVRDDSGLVGVLSMRDVLAAYTI
jgi:CBS domain-containing protein